MSEAPSDAQDQRTRRSASLRPARKHPIHLSPLEAPNRSVIVFVTICSAKRRRILSTPAAHQAILTSWRAANTWLVGRYVIMPDHIHLFSAPNGIDAPPLERWISFWKADVTKALRLEKGGLWQRHHWDRQLRRGDSYESKWTYVRENPVRHELVADPDAWPFQGELNELRW